MKQRFDPKDHAFVFRAPAAETNQTAGADAGPEADVKKRLHPAWPAFYPRPSAAEILSQNSASSSGPKSGRI